MAADSDGLGSAGGGSCGVVVTCEGDLRDPRFPARLRRLLRDLRTLLAEPHPNTLKVNKVEPWNSVRVTLSVPRAAAARLRALAAAGAPQLRALGILSVQLDGDAAVSLRLQHGAELRINTDPDDASTSRSTPNPEVLSSLGTIGRLLADDAGASTSGEASRDNFKSPNTVCPMDGKIPLNIPTHSNERCEFPFGSMTQARVIHRKENTLGITGPTGSIRPPADGPFARPSTSTFPGPPPPYPAPAGPPAPPTPPAAPAPTVAMSSPLLVNLLQNDAPAPQPRSKPPHPAKLDRLEDGQVELAVGRPPFAEYRVRAPPSPSPPASPLCAPRARPPMTRRAPAAHYRARAPFAPPDAPPPPYRTAPPRPRAAPRVTQEDLQALLPPTAATMDQKTQSSFQEFQRYQQQYVARQRAASRGGGGADWNEPYRDSLSLLDLPDSDLEHLMPTLGDVLNMDDSAFSAMSDLDAAAKLDLLLAGGASATPDSLFQDITGESYGGDIPELQAMPPPPPPVSEPQVVTSSPVAVTSSPVAVTSSAAVAVTSLQPAPALTRVPLPPTTLPIRPVIQPQIPRLPPPPPPLPPETLRGPINPPVPLLPLPRVHTATVGSQASAKEIEEQNKRYLIKTLMRDDASPPPDPPKPEVPEVKLESPVPDPIEPIDSEPKRPDDDRGENEKRLDDDSKRPRKEVVRPRTPRDKRDKEPEKESIKLRLKLDKNEPVVQPVYKADVTFLNPPKPDAELRVPPLHISLRGRNSAVIKNSRKEKKKLTPSDPHKKVKSRKSSESDERHRDDGSEVTEASPDPQDLPLNNHVTDPPPEDGVVFRMKTISKNAHIVTKHDYKTNNRVSLDVKPKKKLKILTESKLPERERDKEWRTELDEEGKYAHNEGYRETDGPPVPTVPDEHSDTVQSDALETGVIGEKTGALNDTGVSNDTTGASDTDSKLLKCDEKVEWTHGHGPEPTDTCPDSGTDGPAPARTDPEVTRNDSDDKVVPADVVEDDSVKRTSNDEEADRTNDTDNNLKRTVDGEGKVTRTIDAESPSVPNGVLPDKRRKACAAACPAASPPRSPTSPRRRERVKDKSYCKLVAERAARPHEDKFGGRSPSQAQGEDSGIESMDALSEKSPNQASQSPPAPPRLPPALRHYEPALRDIEAELADLHGEPDSYDKLPPAPPAPQPPAPPPTPPDLTRMPLKADFPDKSLLEQLLIEIPASEYPRGESASPAARSTVRTRSAARLASPGLPPKGAPRRRRRDSDPPPDGAASPSRRKRARPPPAAAPGPRRKDSDSDSDEPLICKVRGTAGAGRGRGVVTRRAARAPAPRRATRSGDAPRPAD